MHSWEIQEGLLKALAATEPAGVAAPAPELHEPQEDLSDSHLLVQTMMTACDVLLPDDLDLMILI